MKPNRLVLLLAGIVLLLAAVSCTSSPKPAVPDIATPAPTSSLPPVLAPEWEMVTVHTLCLEVEQTYHQIEDATFSEPIEETVQSILTRLGLQVVPKGTACEANLTISLTGKGLSREYQGAGTCYTGAKYTGEMSLSMTGRESVTVPISGISSPPFATVGCPSVRTVSYSPVWPEAVLGGLTDIWGIQILIQALGEGKLRSQAVRALLEIGPEAVPFLILALEDDDHSVRRAAVEALWGFGAETVEAVPALILALENEDPWVRSIAAYALGGKYGPAAIDAVPVLIQALEDEVPDVREKAVEALSLITGQDFGDDAAAWQEWWDAQP